LAAINGLHRGDGLCSSAPAQGTAKKKKKKKVSISTSFVSSDVKELAEKDAGAKG
jgi:hypothetical protein